MGNQLTSWISYLSFSAVCICSFWYWQGMVKSSSGHSVTRWGPLMWIVTSLYSDFLSWKLMTLIERFGLSKLYLKSTLVPSNTQRPDKSYVILEEKDIFLKQHGFFTIILFAQTKFISTFYSSKWISCHCRLIFDIYIIQAFSLLLSSVCALWKCSCNWKALSSLLSSGDHALCWLHCWKVS